MTFVGAFTSQMLLFCFLRYVDFICFPTGPIYYLMKADFSIPDPVNPEIIPTSLSMEVDCAIWCLQYTRPCVGFVLIPSQNLSWIEYDVLSSAGYQGQGHEYMNHPGAYEPAYCSVIIGRRTQPIGSKMTFAMGKQWWTG
jgi:hypothetical protein